MNGLRKLAMDVLFALREAGADKAECTITDSSTDEANALGKAVYLLREFDSVDIDIKAIKNGKAAQLRFNTLDNHSIRKHASRCVAMAEYGSPDPKATRIGFSGEIEPDHLIETRDAQRLYERYEELVNYIRLNHPAISSDSMAWYVDRKQFYLNTDGQEYTNHHQKYMCGWQVSASDGEDTTDCVSYFVATDDLNKPFIDCGMMRSKLADAEKMLNPQKIPGGKFIGTLVIQPDGVGYYAWQIRRRIETMEDGDGLPDPSCSECVSIYTAMSDAEYNSNDEPANSPQAKVTYYIKDGKNVGVNPEKLDPIDRARRDAERAKDARRLSCSISGMAGGSTPYADLIKGIKRGLLLGFVSGTMPSPDGEFSGVAKNSFYIEDGEIKYPVIETMVSGNLFEMFKHVEAMSKETICEGDNLYPWVAVGGVTIMSV